MPAATIITTIALDITSTPPISSISYTSTNIAPPTNTPASSASSSNKAVPIGVGIGVGVLALAAIALGLYFLQARLRRHKSQAIPQSDNYQDYLYGQKAELGTDRQPAASYIAELGTDGPPAKLPIQ